MTPSALLERRVPVPRKRICDIAEEVLRETGNPAVLWGDCGLLDEIASRAGLSSPYPWVRWKRVLDALTKQPGNLERGYAEHSGRQLRLFALPEHWTV